MLCETLNNAIQCNKVAQLLNLKITRRKDQIQDYLKKAVFGLHSGLARGLPHPKSGFERAASANLLRSLL